MSFPQFFKPSSDFRPSFNYIDILDGTGYVSYDGVGDQINNKRMLFPSSNMFTGGIQQDDFTRTVGIFDLDFDTSEFQAPRTIEGDMLIGFSAGNYDPVNSNSITYVVTVYHYDGSTETSLGTATTGAVNYAPETSEFYALRITIARTNFKPGDKLRINVTSNHADALLAHNPRDTILSPVVSAGNSRFRVIVPYKLDFL